METNTNQRKVDDHIENNFVGSRVAFMIGDVAFCGTVKRCFLGTQNARTWYIQYDNGDEKILVITFRQQQRFYTKEQ